MEQHEMIIIAIVVIAFLIGLGVFIYFVLNKKKDSQIMIPETTLTPLVGTGTPLVGTGTPLVGTGTPLVGTGTPLVGTGTPLVIGGIPYIAVDPIFPPSSNFQFIVDGINKLKPTPPTDNGEVTLNNKSILLYDDDVLDNTENTAIQNLFTQGTILYDTQTNMYAIAPNGYHPPQYGAPTLDHVIDVLNSLPITVENDKILYVNLPLTTVSTIIPGISNQRLSQLFNVRFKYNNGMFVKL